MCSFFIARKGSKNYKYGNAALSFFITYLNFFRLKIIKRQGMVTLLQNALCKSESLCLPLHTEKT